VRAARALVGLGAAAAMLAGCASIPTASTVRQGDEVLAGGQDDPFIRVLARPPVDGMSQRQIVAGFLEASASFDGNHEVARQYLAPEVRGSWDPASGTVVYDGSSVVFSEDPAANTVAVRAPEVARISDRGEYAASGPNVALAADFALRLVDDQWRIAAAPAGLALTTLDVSRAFRAYNLYFLDPTGSRLVPDQVFVPVQQPGIATTLVRSVLLGPTPWLAPAVSTAVPPGTSLTVDSVPVEERVARVDLSAEALDSAPEARERMSAQLVWTLAQLPEVARVELTVNGVDLQVPGVANPQSRTSWPQYDPDGFPAGGPPGYAIRDGALVALGDPIEPVSGPLGSGNPPVSSAAVSQEGDRVAAVVGGSRLVAGPVDAPVEVAGVAGAEVTSLSWDPLGTVWVAERRAAGSVISAVGVDGVARAVAAPELAGQQVSVVRLARDGCRAAVVAAGAGGGPGQLYLARVVRAADGALALEALRRVESSLVSVSDVAWRDADRIIALARDGRGVEQPFLVSGDGGAVRVTGSLPGLTALAAAPGSPLLGATADGRLWADNGTGWALIGPGQAPAYPG
jgi:hypothetical protein